MIEILIVLGLHGDPPLLFTVQPHLQGAATHALHGTQGAVLHPEALLILQEQDPITGRKFARSPGRLEHLSA